MSYEDPLAENYYAFLLALTYPYFITSDEALEAIQHGTAPMRVTEQTLMDGLKLSRMAHEPRKFADVCGRRYEIVKLISGVITICDSAMARLRDYELEEYRDTVLEFMNTLIERMEKNKIR